MDDSKSTQPSTCTQPGKYTQQPDLYTGQEEHGDDDLSSDEFVADPNKKGIGESLNTREDELLCDAWLNISIDPVHGTEQNFGPTFITVP